MMRAYVAAGGAGCLHSCSMPRPCTGLYRDIPLPGHPAVAEYVINPEPPDTRHIVLLTITWLPDKPTEPGTGDSPF